MTWEQLKVLILVVPNVPIITGTNFFHILHILLTSISRYLFLVIFSVSSVLNFESSGLAMSISRQVFSLLSNGTIPDQFASIIRSVIIGTCHIMAVQLTFMTFSVVAYLSVTCNAVCLHIV